MVDEIPKLPENPLPPVSSFDGFIAGIYKTVFYSLCKPLKGFADWMIALHNWVAKKANIDPAKPEQDLTKQ